jgi:GTP:adenosylcobinamide-phosphate guanylyltransferase
MDNGVVAAVMAAGRWKGEVPAGGSPWRSLYPLAGRPMLAYVLDALERSRTVTETILVGPAELSEAFPGVARIDAGAKLTDNVEAACRYAAGKGTVLLTGCDIPLVTAGAIDYFVRECSFNRTRLYYPILEKRAVLKDYPSMKRTFVRMADGTFTGGNVFLAQPDFILDQLPVIQSIYAARKKPLRLAGLLGWELMFRLLLTSGAHLPLLDVTTASRLVGKALGGLVKAIVIPYPSLGADLDSLDEAPLFEKYLLARRDRASAGRRHSSAGEAIASR